MMNTQKAEPRASIDEDFVSDLNHTVEQATEEFIRTFERSASEVKEVIVQEFSRAPWLYFTACLGSGILIGYMVSHKSRRAECRT